MSRSPTEGQAASNQDAYQESWRQLNEFIIDGRSLSGHERNCCFLNVRGGRFASVASAVEFDWPDDARALATSDWDQDGDLDFWLTNRTGPRLRFLRNDLVTEPHFLAITLQGSPCNRDAIGTRVEVHVADQSGAKLVKTLRAGEGFLSQGSKWLHFGLGDSSRIERLQVRWPDGRLDEFTRLDADSFYRLAYGGAARRWAPHRGGEILRPAPQPDEQRSASRVLLAGRVPLPPLEFETFDGIENPLTGSSDAPVLVNLWASWCQPCLSELAEFARHQDRLRAAGLRVHALSVDGLVGHSETDPSAAPAALRELGFPFDAGRATTALVEKLQLIHEQLFDQPRTLPVPTSLLIDAEGALAAVYRGPVQVDQLLKDVEALSRESESASAAANPFAGRWFIPPRPLPLEDIAWGLVEHEYIDDGVQYARQHKAAIAPKSFGKVTTQAGTLLMRRGEASAAVRLFREALESVPDEPVALNNLAWLLATSSDARVRNGKEAVGYAKRAAQAMGSENVSALDTLAAAYAEAGMFQDAEATARRALDLARRSGPREAVESISRHLEAFSARQPVRQK